MGSIPTLLLRKFLNLSTNREKYSTQDFSIKLNKPVILVGKIKYIAKKAEETWDTSVEKFVRYRIKNKNIYRNNFVSTKF